MRCKKVIVVEPYKEGYIKTYSNAGVKIQRDGRLFITAIDPVDSDREYVETDIPVPVPEED